MGVRSYSSGPTEPLEITSIAKSNAAPVAVEEIKEIGLSNAYQTTPSSPVANSMHDQVEKLLQIDVPQGDSTDLIEVGSVGINRWGGSIFEDFLPNLNWPYAGKIYQEMSNNDPVIGSIMYVAEQLLRKANWTVRAASDSKEDRECADFLLSCMNDMSMTWKDVITDVLSMLVYGFSYHEIVYKKREGWVKDPKRKSKYDDGRIGWRRLPIRSQRTVHEWKFEDDDDSLIGMEQLAPPRYDRVFIPIEKALLFKTKNSGGNPEGKSLLRNSYRPWYFKKKIEEIEGIGLERDLAGLPVLKTPQDVDIWNDNNPIAVRTRNIATATVRNIRRDQNEGVVLPFGWELALLSTQGRRQFDTNTIVNRYDQRIAITLLSDIVMLGSDKVGSFALASVKKSLMASALETIAQNIAEVINRYGVPRLIALNVFPGITEFPKVDPGEIETPDLTELARYITALTGAKMQLFPDLDLENYLRGVAGMPEKSQETFDREQKEKEEEKKREEEFRERISNGESGDGTGGDLDGTSDDGTSPPGIPSGSRDGRLMNGNALKK